MTCTAKQHVIMWQEKRTEVSTEKIEWLVFTAACEGEQTSELLL